MTRDEAIALYGRVFRKRHGIGPVTTAPEIVIDAILEAAHSSETSNSSPVMWVEAEPAASGTAAADVVRGVLFSTTHHLQSERPTPRQAGNVLIPLCVAQGEVQGLTADEAEAGWFAVNHRYARASFLAGARWAERTLCAKNGLRLARLDAARPAGSETPAAGGA